MRACRESPSLRNGWRAASRSSSHKHGRANSSYYAINPYGRVPYLCARRRRRSGGVRCHLRLARSLPGRTDVRSAVGRRGMGDATSRSLGQKPVGWTFSLRSRDPAARRRAFTIRDPPRVGTRQPHGRSCGRREIAHPWMRGALDLAQITLGCALGLEAQKSESTLADGTCETLRLVRPHRRTAVVRGDSTASCSLKIGPGTEPLTLRDTSASATPHAPAKAIIARTPESRRSARRWRRRRRRRCRQGNCRR